MDPEPQNYVVHRTWFEDLLARNPDEERFIVSMETVNGATHLAIAPHREVALFIKEGGA